MGDPVLWRSSVLTLAAVGQTALVTLYVTFPWWRSFLGRALFFNAVTLAVTLDLIAAARWVGRTRDDTLFLLIYSVLALGIWVQTAAFVRVMLTSRRKDWDQHG